MKVRAYHLCAPVAWPATSEFHHPCFKEKCGENVDWLAYSVQGWMHEWMSERLLNGQSGV
jgi:hypothetical protein